MLKKNIAIFAARGKYLFCRSTTYSFTDCPNNDCLQIGPTCKKERKKIKARKRKRARTVRRKRTTNKTEEQKPEEDKAEEVSPEPLNQLGHIRI